MRDDGRGAVERPGTRAEQMAAAAENRVQQLLLSFEFVMLMIFTVITVAASEYSVCAWPCPSAAIVFTAWVVST